MKVPKTKCGLKKAIYHIGAYFEDVKITNDGISVVFGDDYDQEAAENDAGKVGDYLVSLGILDPEDWEEGNDFYFDEVWINEDELEERDDYDSEEEEWRYAAEWGNLGRALKKFFSGKSIKESYKECKALFEEVVGSDAVYHPLGFDIIYADQNTNPESQKIHCYMISTAKSRFNFDLPLTRNMTKEEIETATLTGYENLSKVWCETTQEWILDEEHCQGMDLSQYAPMRERGLIFYPNAKLVQIYAGEDHWVSSDKAEVSGIVVYAMKEEA